MVEGGAGEAGQGAAHFLDRREFLAKSGSAGAGAWLMRALPLLAAVQACAAEAERTGAGFVVFTDREAADFDAFAARILPTDETPGAREAGAMRFADQALADVFSNLLPIVRPGLESLDERAQGRGGSFADLPEERQDEVITEIESEDPGFFFFAKTLVMAGVFANVEYGGNQDIVGWNMIGFESDFGYQPPFGYYDRNEHGQAADGEDGA